MKTFLALLVLLLLTSAAAAQTYDERAQLSLTIQRPANAYVPPQAGTPYVTEQSVFDTVPPNAPPGSISVAEMHRRASVSPMAGRSGIAGNPNCPCAAMGGCSCQNCQCDLVRGQYLQRAAVGYQTAGQPQYMPAVVERTLPAVQYVQQPVYQQPAYVQPAVQYAPAVSYAPTYSMPAYSAGVQYASPSYSGRSYGAGVRYGSSGGGCANGQCGAR